MRHAQPVVLAALLAALSLTSACRSAGTGVLPPQPPPPPPAGAAAPAEPVRLTIVGTNDLHGWAMAQPATLPGGATTVEGGSAVFAGYLARVREDNPGGVVLLDAGDLFQGTLASNLTEGATVVDVYNHLGYDAVAVGNHEFDYGPAGPAPVAGPGGDPFGALKARIAQARFPFLAVNVYEQDTGRHPAWMGNDGTLLLERKGVKIGVMGLATPSTPTTTNPVNVASLRFGSLVPETQAAARRLREAGAEVVIGVAHAGGRCPNTADPHDLSSCDRKDGEIFDLVDALEPGTLDALVAGHTHQVMGHFFHGLPVIETSGQGRSFGTVELWVDPQTRKVLPGRTRIQAGIPVCLQVDRTRLTCAARALREGPPPDWVPATYRGRPVAADAAVERLLAPALERVAKLQTQPLGVTVPRPLTRHFDDESGLGSLLADTLREHERADVAILNPGGLRADLVAQQPTYGHVYEVLPFDNSIATLSLTGEELTRLLKMAFGAKKGVFQVSGLRLQLARCPGPERLVSAAQADGKPLDPRRRYKVVLPDFLARGGDGLMPVTSSLPPERVDLGLTRSDNLRDALVEQWKARGRPLVAPRPGRTTFVGPGQSCAAPVVPPSVRTAEAHPHPH